jgi:hypothetical protein
MAPMAWACPRRGTSRRYTMAKIVPYRPHWIDVGRAYERFALQATALGICNAFLNQPVEVPSIRSQFCRMARCRRQATRPYRAIRPRTEMGTAPDWSRGDGVLAVAGNARPRRDAENHRALTRRG